MDVRVNITNKQGPPDYVKQNENWKQRVAKEMTQNFYHRKKYCFHILSINFIMIDLDFRCLYENNTNKNMKIKCSLYLILPTFPYYSYIKQ